MRKSITLQTEIQALMTELGFGQAQTQKSALAEYFTFDHQYRFVTSLEAIAIVLSRFPELKISKDTMSNELFFQITFCKPS
jgi:hypothetical protein